MQAMKIPSVRVVLAEGYVDSRILTYVTSKLLRGNIFGISKVMPWGVNIHSQLINNHEERTQALATAVQYAQAVGVRGKYREAIELVTDELLMNALYNAPVGPSGPLFNDVAPQQRANLRLERPTILQLAHDGARFVVGVRDSFGSLKPETIFSFIERCLSSADQIDRKTSGAGLGLYLVANNVTELIFNVLPGTATEVICVFDVRAPKQQLQHLGLYSETFARHAELEAKERGPLIRAQPAAGQAAAQPLSKLIPLTLTTAVLLLLVAAVLMVWPYLSKPATGSLKVTVEPSGSTVYINGVRKGVGSPHLTIEHLAVSGTYAVSARLPGYAEAQEPVSVVKGEVQQVKLTLAQHGAKVRVSSTPSGAEIWLDGKNTGQRTPTLLDTLAPGRTYNIRLVKHGHIPHMGQLKPIADETLRFQVDLPLATTFARLSLDSEPTGARLYLNDVDTGAITPVKGHVLRTGQTYRVKLELPKHVPWEVKIQPEKGEQVYRSATLRLGGYLTLASNVRAVARVGKAMRFALPLKRTMVPVGAYPVRIISDDPYLRHTFNLTISAGASTNRYLQFGFVASGMRNTLLQLGGQKVKKLALPPGKHQVTLFDLDTRKSRVETVEVIPGKTQTLR
jgi:hypothetical protein